MTELDLAAVHARLDTLLAREGARVGGYHHCPHDKGRCDCRKPGTALLERARDQLGLETLARTWMVGDAASDVEAGRRAGARTIFLGERAPGDADHTAPSLADAVRWLLDA